MKRGRQIKKEYLVLCKYYPVSEAQWISAANLRRPSELQGYVEKDDPRKKRYSCEDIAIVRVE